MQMSFRHFRKLAVSALAVASTIVAFSGSAYADPPSRVARMGYMSGAVSFSPAGEDDWIQAAINRPLTTGDRLWVDGRSRAELQLGGAMIRLNADTGLTILNLDDDIAQLQLTQGAMTVNVRRLAPRQVFEIDTPNLAFTVRQPGVYRVEVDADGNATTIVVRRGKGEAYGEDASYVIDSRQSYRFSGTRLNDYEFVDMPRPDEFDRWASDRDRRYESSVSARYVSQDVIGYQDLDANGTWRNDATYGNVWFPNRVAAGWAPYRDGHWAWIDPWGWTWVDDAPWGFAVSHYGRWTNLRGTWGWVPGPVSTRAYYAPALVAFVGGSNFQLSASSGSGVAWFPLAPREVYRPSYAVSRGYFENVNRSNTVINTTVINNYYNNSNVTNVTYVNRQVAGAVIAVPTATFVQSQPVSRAAVRVTRDLNAGAAVAFAPTVAPTQRSVRGAAEQGSRPPGRGFERPVVARTAPPVLRAGFAAQQSQLTAKPGRPLDDADRKQLKPAPAVTVPAVKVVAPAQVAPPTALPPRVAPTDKTGNNGRGRQDDRRPSATAPNTPNAGAPVVLPQARPPSSPAVAPSPATPQAVPQVAPQVAPIAPAPAPATSPAQRGKPGTRDERDDSPRQPARPAAPPVVLPQGPAANQATPQPDPRGRSEQRGNSESRGPAAAPPPSRPAPQAVPPAAAPAPVAAPPVVAPPVPPAEPRGRNEPRGRGEARGQGAAPAPQAPANNAPVPRVEPPRVVPPAAPAAPVAVPAPAPKAEPRGQDAKPAPGKSKERKKEKDGDESDRDEEKRKKKD